MWHNIIILWGRLFCEPASASLELWVSFCKPRSKHKNGHDALIPTVFITCRVLHCANTKGNGTTFSYQTRPTKRNRNVTIFYSFTESLHKRSRAVNWCVKNGTANFGQTSPIERDPEYSGWKKPKWILAFDFRQKFQESLAYKWKHPWSSLCWCTVAWQVCWWKVFLSFFYFYQLGR